MTFPHVAPEETGVGHIPVLPQTPETRSCNCCTQPFFHNDRRRKHCSDACAAESKRLHRNARQSTYQARFPERERAKQVHNRAIRAEQIRRPVRCEDCGERRFVEGHHEDYSRPYYVIWLCRPCHAKLEGGRHFGAGQTKSTAHDLSVRRSVRRG